jgi:hypothetical protein
VESEIYKKSLRDPPRSRDRIVPPPRHSPSWPIHARARLFTVGGAQRLRLHPPLPLAAGTLARRRLVSTLHPGRLLRRRLVSILHPGRPCAAGSSRSSTRVESSAWAPALGSHCGLRGRLRHRRAARSEPIVHALQVPRPTPPSSARASRLLRLSRALRVAPLSASRPRPRRARLPTPAPRPRQIGSRGRRRGCSSARTSPPTGREECSEL